MSMSVFVRVAAAVTLAGGLCACATVTRGTSTDFKVATTPPGAQVMTSTGFRCGPTPCELKLPRKTPFDATVSLEGYETQTIHVKSEVSNGGAAGFAGNVVAGGLVGMAVDGSDGAMNDLKPNPLTVTLQATPPAAPPATPTAAPSDQGAAPATTPSQ
jgi:hypothetical protein